MIKDHKLHALSISPYILIVSSIVCAVLFWVFESYRHYSDFHDSSFFTALFSPNQHELWMRSFVVVLFIGFGFWGQILLNKLKRAGFLTKQLNKELHQIFNTAADGMCVIDKDFNTIRVNKNFLTMVGFSSKEIIGKKCYEILHDSRCQTPDCPLKRIIKGENLVKYEAVKELKDGSQITCLITATPFHSFDDELLGIVKNFKDISDRIKGENKLRETTSYLENLISYASAPIIVWGNEFKITRFNSAFERLTGYSESEVIDQKLHMLFPAENSGESIREIEKTLAGEYWKSVEIPILCKDGRVKVVLWNSANVYNENGKTILATIAQGVDVTERLEIKKQLIQAHKMEAIGTLAGGIAHDFNNILGVILGYTDMLKDDAPPGSKSQKNLYKVLIAANRAKALVQQILAFSRQSEVDRMIMKIQPLIKEGLKMLRSSIPSTISITSDIDPQGGVILADPTQIHQILINLCINAYHAMEASGGNISVSLRTTHIDMDDQKMLLPVIPGEYVELTVSDTGVGIGPDVIGKIFDPYFTTKGIGKGTGMGLAIIHGIMTEYGGAITVDSQLGKGSTFHAYFPVVERDALPEIKEDECLPKGGKERILFVDDEELLAEMGKDMLERLGYHVTVQRSSIEALATFQNTPKEFDIVITDQTMPDMTGSDLARRMMQIRPDVPIILCTGYSNLINEDSAKGLGIKEFVLKPLTKGVIAKLIRKVLDAK